MLYSSKCGIVLIKMLIYLNRYLCYLYSYLALFHHSEWGPDLGFIHPHMIWIHRIKSYVDSSFSFFDLNKACDIELERNEND